MENVFTGRSNQFYEFWRIRSHQGTNSRRFGCCCKTADWKWIVIELRNSNWKSYPAKNKIFSRHETAIYLFRLLSNYERVVYIPQIRSSMISIRIIFSWEFSTCYNERAKCTEWCWQTLLKNSIACFMILK